MPCHSVFEKKAMSKDSNVTEQKDIFSALRRNSTLLIVLAIGLMVIEFEIFVVAAMRSGRQSRLQIFNHSGEVIYETDGGNLSSFDKYYFEKTFGPFEQYQVKLITREIPFPFRAWFTAAIGIPIGLILLFVFIVKAYAALFHGEISPTGKSQKPDQDASRLEKILFELHQLNIFTIGFVIFVLIFSYWAVPNSILYIGRVGMETMARYKWAIVISAAAALGLVVWVIYLRYLLAKKAMETRAEVDRYRLELEYQHGRTMAIGCDEERKKSYPAIGWEECPPEETAQVTSDSSTRVKQ